MLEKEINEQLNKEYECFIYSAYNGKVKPPKDIIELFKRAILSIPPFAHKILFTKVRAISTTKYVDLTNSDLNDIIKVVLNTTLEKLYPNEKFEVMVEKQIKMDAFVISYNSHVEEFKKSLEQKKISLQSITNGLPRTGSKLVALA